MPLTSCRNTGRKRLLGRIFDNFQTFFGKLRFSIAISVGFCYNSFVLTVDIFVWNRYKKIFPGDSRRTAHLQSDGTAELRADGALEKLIRLRAEGAKRKSANLSGKRTEPRMNPNRSVFLQTDFFVSTVGVCRSKRVGASRRGDIFFRSLSASRFKNVSRKNFSKRKGEIWIFFTRSFRPLTLI